MFEPLCTPSLFMWQQTLNQWLFIDHYILTCFNLKMEIMSCCAIF